uniref:RNA polymerase I subunit E n=1 Tax=Knipowitschia caucasica TaxID=637954 RepID=A0AAV2LLL7_KNICA
MAASCSIVCCNEEEVSDKAVVVQFSNGSVEDPDQLHFSVFKNTDERNPRKKSRRILVAESDRLAYVGDNFGPGSMKCNNICKYYVGVLNKETMQMEMHNAQLFHLQPVIPGETDSEKSLDTNLTYREKVDSLIEAFGTNKQKRALSSRRLNQVGSDALHHAVDKAADTVIELKGLEALQQEVAESESQGDVALHLPPSNAQADIPENVYEFESLLSSADLEALRDVGAKMAALSPDEMQKMKDAGGNLCVIKHLENLPQSVEARERILCCSFYLSMLIHLARERRINRKFGQEYGCPRSIQNKLLKTFTVETYKNGSVQNVIPASMRVKVAAYSLALLLHMNFMSANLTLLHRDLGITEARMIEVAKSMGLTLSKSSKAKGEASLDDYKYATLNLPLVKHDKFTMQRKRRKMR